MGVYRDCVLPWLCGKTMSNRRLRPYRNRVVGEAAGRVLEVGVGAGQNLPLYGARVSGVIALEPAPKLVAMARRRARGATVPVTFLEASSEAIPVEDRSVDTVVTTWTLCTIPDAALALREMRRVLRPGGRLLFVEHGLAPDAGVRRWQTALTPMWSAVSGGCHLDRPIPALIEASGFRVERMDAAYLRGPNPLTWMVEGSARPG